MRQPMPPVAAVISFIDGINRGDVGHLATLMADEHRLQVFDESPVDGKAANLDAWAGHASSFPDYVIYPHQVVTRNAEVAVLGHTTGSHLGLPDDQESTMTLLWRAIVKTAV